MNIDQLHQLDVEQLGDQFANLEKFRKTFAYESTLQTNYGEQIPVQVYVRSVTIDGTKHYQWIFRDITERKKIDRVREDLIAMIYHDLRSPLANVVSSLEVLKNILPDDNDETVQSILKIAQRSTERIQRLTNSLLDVNRLNTGQPILAQGPASLNELVSDAIEAVDLLVASKNHSLETDLPTSLLPVYVDGDMIRRVLINLLENAIKYTPSNGLISIGAKSKDEWVEIWVKDTGRGISEEEQKNIFDKLYLFIYNCLQFHLNEVREANTRAQGPAEARKGGFLGLA
jgi:signal transduction histidine kinase